MKYKIIWSDFAETQLDEIHDYYKNVANASIANTLVASVIHAADSLKDAPFIGPEEE